MNRGKSKWAVTVTTTILFSFIAARASAEQSRYRFSPASAVGFEAKSTLHPFTGRTRQISGDFEVNWDNLPLSKGGFLELSASTLETGNSLRDKKMRNEHLQTNRYPVIRFESTSCVGLFNAGKKEPTRLILTGYLHLHGVPKPVEIPVVLSRNEKNQLKISGKVPLRLSDHRIPVPSVFGLIKMEEEVLVTFDLEAEPI